MTVGERIAARRKELNMTQDDLARKLGYKSRSSINKIELSLSKVPLSKLARIADALDCEAAFLMGWKDNSDKNDAPVSDYDRRFLSWFHSLPEEKRRAILIAQDAPKDLL